MDPDDLVSSFLILLALIALSAFFVAAEFAILTLRRRRVEQIARDAAGRAPAPAVISERAEELSLAAQLGSVVCILLTGVVAARLSLVIVDGLVAAAALLVGIAVAALVYLVVGQQIPRLLGAQRPTWVANPAALLPLRVLALLLRPLILPLSLVLSKTADALGLSRSAFYAPMHTLEDLRELLAQGHEQGVVEEDEREMIHGVFEFADTVAREVMTPRIDIIAVPRDVSLDALMEVVVGEGHSRIPVFHESIDDIVGVVLVKDLLPVLAAADWDRRTAFDVSQLMREPYFVPESKPVGDILREFRLSNVHLAIVIDEFGGTYGLVTMEDLLEEIVGEIQDEYDVEEPDFAPTPEGDILIDGGASISEVNERFGLEIPEEDFDTIGGYIFGTLGRVPVPGDRVDRLGEGGTAYLEVEEAEDRRVTRVRLRKSAEVGAPEGGR